MKFKSGRILTPIILIGVLNTVQTGRVRHDSGFEAFAAPLETKEYLAPPTSNSTSDFKDLDQPTQTALPRFGKTIRETGEIYGIDWRLLLAIIKQESRFHTNAESFRGARGLMQIMPATEAEVSERLGIDNLSLPRHNIKGGAYYLAQLFTLFDGVSRDDRLKLTLAAYNAGAGRIYDAQEIAAYLGENPTSWTSIEKVLPLLSKRYYTLHRSVWDGGKPRNGYFGKSRQTIDYVSKVSGYFDRYKSLLD